MRRRAFGEGSIWLAAGLLCTSTNSLVDRFAGAAPAADLARGSFDGLAVVTIGMAVYFLVQHARSSSHAEQGGQGR